MSSHILLRHAFEQWHDLWWTARREWGLSVRADLHDRYRICSKVWKAWRDHVIIRRAKTATKKMTQKYRMEISFVVLYVFN